MKAFSIYRRKDYVTPRSTREAYGWDAPLYVYSEPQRGWLYAAIGCALFVGVLLCI